MTRVALSAYLQKCLRSRRGPQSQCEWREVAPDAKGRWGSAQWKRGLAPLLVVAGSLSFGCAPSREALTAGEVGCPPSELSVHDEESSSGWAQSADTWIAECRGRRFVCTEVVTSGIDYSWLFSDSVDSRDSDVSCHEELSAEPERVAQPTPPAAHD
jgi:hypothetical protein